MSQADVLHFKLVTPAGVRYDDIAEKVTIPTDAGEVTILPRHSVLVSVLQTGEITIHKPDGTVSLAISHGILEVRPNNELIVLADTAEHATEIDVERALLAKEKAERLLKEAGTISTVEYTRLQAQIEKEMVRITVGNKYKDVT